MFAPLAKISIVLPTKDGFASLSIVIARSTESQLMRLGCERTSFVTFGFAAPRLPRSNSTFHVCVSSIFTVFQETSRAGRARRARAASILPHSIRNAREDCSRLSLAQDRCTARIRTCGKNLYATFCELGSSVARTQRQYLANALRHIRGRVDMELHIHRNQPATREGNLTLQFLAMLLAGVQSRLQSIPITVRVAVIVFFRVHSHFANPKLEEPGRRLHGLPFGPVPVRCS
jgi:hypothetical protein